MCVGRLEKGFHSHGLTHCLKHTEGSLEALLAALPVGTLERLETWVGCYEDSHAEDMSRVL